MKLKPSDRKQRLLILISVLAAIAIGVWFWAGRQVTAVEFGAEKVERGSLRQSVPFPRRGGWRNGAAF
jgi:HAMP domain-containing protein